MDDIGWDGSLCLGVKEIDDDHESLIQIFNSLFEAHFSGASPSFVDQALVKLVEYTDGHFQREEAMMEIAGYPHLASHKEEHNSILQSALRLQEKFIAGEMLSLNSYTLSFLRSWLENHILAADNSFVLFLRRSRAGEGIEQNLDTLCVS